MLAPAVEVDLKTVEKQKNKKNKKRAKKKKKEEWVMPL